MTGLVRNGVPAGYASFLGQLLEVISSGGLPPDLGGRRCDRRRAAQFVADGYPTLAGPGGR